MKRRVLAMIVTLAGWLLAAPARAVDLDVSVSFYAELAPYGEWIEHDRFGTVWAPGDVDVSWRPYTRGEWTYTDDGWTWVSDEDWGWATDHYGRWYLDPEAGWIWIPGDEWAPAWVAWRHGDGYVGWAPLPPDVDAFDGVDVDLDPLVFCFVEQRRLLEPSVFRFAVPVARNVTFFGMTRNATRYHRRRDRVFVGGIDVDHFERVIGRPVPRVRIREARSAAEARRERIRHGEVALFHPRVAIGRPDAAHRDRGVWRSRFRANRPERVERRQERERRQLESTFGRERRQIETEQRHEIRRAPEVERRQEHSQPRPNAAERSNWLNREKLQERHEAERKAQGEHEQRQRGALERRQQREQSQSEKGKSEESHRKRERH